MTRDDVLQKVTGLLSEMTDADEITESSNLMDDLDIGSMDVLAMCGSLEELFNTSISEKMIRKMYT
ncbi:MAG: hypothetical protein KBS79_03075, partial [Lachnospiraceae bacterium]|nr:hypothetical protein [Candidatus Minthocola equi]